MSVLLALATLAPACSPLTATPAFHFAETAETLGRSQTSVTLAGGGGVMGLDGWGAGAALRIRTAVASRQELGLEASLLGIDTGKRHDGETRPYIGQSTAFSAKLSYKGAPTGWLALVGGAGMATAAVGDSVGLDAGAIFSTDHGIGGIFRPYGGLRLALAVPLFASSADSGGVTVGTVVAGGAAFAIGPSVRVTAEGGFLGAWSHPHGHDRVFHAGFYFGASLGYVFGAAPGPPPTPAPATPPPATPAPTGG